MGAAPVSYTHLYITDDDEEMLEELTEALEVFLDITPEDVDEAVPRTRRTVNQMCIRDRGR